MIRQFARPQRSILWQAALVVVLTVALTAVGTALVMSQHRYLHSTRALVDMTPSDLGHAAALVVQGSVVGQTRQLDPNGRHVITKTTVQVHATYKGSPSSTVVVLTQGGSAANVTEVAEDEPTFANGQEIVLFLAPQGDGFVTVGAFQGRYFVNGATAANEKGSLPVHDLVNAAQAR